MTNKKTRGNFGCQAARLVRLSRLFGSQEGLTKLNTPGKAKLGPAGNTVLFEFGRKRRGKMLQRGPGRLWGAPAARAGSWALPRGCGGGHWVPQNCLLAPPWLLFGVRAPSATAPGGLRAAGLRCAGCPQGPAPTPEPTGTQRGSEGEREPGRSGAASGRLQHPRPPAPPERRGLVLYLSHQVFLALGELGFAQFGLITARFGACCRCCLLFWCLW